MTKVLHGDISIDVEEEAVENSQPNINALVHKRDELGKEIDKLRQEASLFYAEKIELSKEITDLQEKLQVAIGKTLSVSTVEGDDTKCAFKVSFQGSIELFGIFY